jgi:hypothetical protein
MDEKGLQLPADLAALFADADQEMLDKYSALIGRFVELEQLLKEKTDEYARVQEDLRVGYEGEVAALTKVKDEQNNLALEHVDAVDQEEAERIKKECFRLMIEVDQKIDDARATYRAAQEDAKKMYNDELAVLKHERAGLFKASFVRPSTTKTDIPAYFGAQKNTLRLLWRLSKIFPVEPWGRDAAPDRIRRVREYVESLPNPIQRELLERTIVGRYEAIYKTLGNGDCFYRSLLLGLLHHLHQGVPLGFGAHLVGKLEAYSRVKLSGRWMNPVSQAAKLLIDIIDHRAFLRFDFLYDLCMADSEVSHALVYLLRVMAADAWEDAQAKPESERDDKYYGNVARIRSPHVDADVLDFMPLIQRLGVRLTIFNFIEDKPTVIPDAELEAWSPTISVLCSGEHYDLLVERLSFEEDQLMGRQARQEQEYLQMLAGQWD